MNTDQAYQDGYDAWEPRKALKNPHSPASDPELFDSYNIGWLDARDEQRLYTNDDRARQGLGMPNASEY